MVIDSHVVMMVFENDPSVFINTRWTSWL